MNPLNPLIGQWDNQEYGKYLPKRCRKVHLHQSSMGIYFSTDDKKSETNGNLSGLPWKKSFFWMSSRHSDDNADMMFIYQTTRSWRIPVTNWNPLFFYLGTRLMPSLVSTCINYHHVNLNMRDRHPHLVICWSPFRCAGSRPTRSTETKTVVTTAGIRPTLGVLLLGMAMAWFVQPFLVCFGRFCTHFAWLNFLILKGIVLMLSDQ